MPWFRRYGWFHVPVSVTDTLYGVYPFIIPTLLLLDWGAARSSERRLN